MKLVNRTQAALLTFAVAIIAGLDALRSRSDDDSDRGDVPGWVMITLMTAIVVTGLLVIFRTQVIAAVGNAFNSVN